MHILLFLVQICVVFNPYFIKILTHTHTHTHPPPTPTPVHPKPCAVKVETLTDSCLQDPLYISTREEQNLASGEYLCSSITDAVHMTAFLLKHGIICKCYALRRLPGDFGDSVFLAKNGTHGWTKDRFCNGQGNM